MMPNLLISPECTLSTLTFGLYPCAYVFFYFLVFFIFSNLQATGVTVNEEVIDAFTDFKLKRGEFHVRFFIYKIENKKNIVIEKIGDLSKTYEDFCEQLPENDCRYGLIDLDFETSDGRETSKLLFISWNPDTGPVRAKMLYSGSKEAMKVALNGVGIHINATDYSELDFETAILPVVRKFA